MMQQYMDAEGNYLGAWDTSPPNGSLIVETAPERAPATWDFDLGVWNYPETDPITPDIISRRQFFQALASPTILEAVTDSDETIISEAEAEAALEGVIPPPLETIILTLPSDQQFPARMLVKGATEFNRTHPLSEIVRASIEWTQAQQDHFWRLASEL